MIRLFRLAFGIIIVFLVAGNASAGDIARSSDGKVPGKPFKYLQEQIDELREQLNDLQPGGEPSEIKVYDANDQFLGILLSKDLGILEVFIPSLNTTTRILTSVGYTVEPSELFTSLGVNWGTLSYASTDCSGQPYGYQYAIALGSDDDYRWFIPVNEPPVFIEQNSSKGPSLDCNELVWGSMTEFKVPMIELPAEEIPFSVPVAFPIRFEYAGDALN